jgi:ring-1,2-phenylacetyl-CoA epoxidase subunit PaaD
VVSPPVVPGQTTPPAGVALDETAVFEALRAVPDPEIPAISVVDLGVIGRIDVAGGHLRVELLPTFVGCPALDPMRDAVARRLAALAPDREIEVAVVFDPPWTSDRITPDGRRRLTASGFAPPEGGEAGGDGSGTAVAAGPRPIVLDAPVPCPWCGSRTTRLESVFGPTACRSIRYCTACRQPFEQFKTV